MNLGYLTKLHQLQRLFIVEWYQRLYTVGLQWEWPRKRSCLNTKYLDIWLKGKPWKSWSRQRAKRPRLDPKISRIQLRRLTVWTLVPGIFHLSFFLLHKTHNVLWPQNRGGSFPVCCQRTGRKSAEQTNPILLSLIAYGFNSANHLNRQTICQQMFHWGSTNKQNKVANWYRTSSWQRDYYSRHAFFFQGF